jgi:hypothetical protein
LLQVHSSVGQISRTHLYIYVANLECLICNSILNAMHCTPHSADMQVAEVQGYWALIWKHVHGDFGEGRVVGTQEMLQPFIFHYQRLFLLLHSLQDASPGLAVCSCPQ